MSNKLPLNPSKWWILRLNIDRVNRRSKLNRPNLYVPHQKRVLTNMETDWYFHWLLSTTLIFFFHWPSSIFSKKKNPVFFRRITNGFFIFIIRRTGRRQNIFTFQTDLKINRATISPWIGIMTGEFCNDFVILWSKYWNKLLLFQQKLSRILIFV